MSGWKALKPYGASQQMYPWWHDDNSAFHTPTRLDGDSEGLLVDIGACDSLIGDERVKQVTARAERAGKE
eukprot:12931009-Prorocentrum_lima.AAC.1